MPDHKETGRKPTKRERETVFAPHHSPKQQPDGDPGRVPRPDIERDNPRTGEENAGEENAGDDTAA